MPVYALLIGIEGALPILYIAVHSQCEFGEAMATSKTATLTFRIDPDLKDALRVAAGLEHRSIANMVEVLIRDHCEQRGIAIPPFVEAEKKNGARS